jgi:hypothetical protein
MKRFLALLFFSGCWIGNLSAQNRTILVQQPPELRADAGKDIVITAGQACRLGDNPTASGGSGTYIYQWEPTTSLNNATLPNPIANPGRTTTYTVLITDESNCTATSVITVVVQASGISDQPVELSVIVYPNPTDGQIHLDAFNCNGTCIIQVFNSLGQEIQYRQVVSAGMLQEKFDLTGQSPGLYYLRVINGGNLVIKPVILK